MELSLAIFGVGQHILVMHSAHGICGCYLQQGKSYYEHTLSLSVHNPTH